MTPLVIVLILVIGGLLIWLGLLHQHIDQLTERLYNRELELNAKLVCETWLNRKLQDKEEDLGNEFYADEEYWEDVLNAEDD